MKNDYLKKKLYMISKNEVGANRQEDEEEIVGSDIGPNGQAIGSRGEIGDPNDGLFSGIDNVGFVREPRDLGELGVDTEHQSNDFMPHIDMNNTDKENREILSNMVGSSLGDEISIIEFD